MWYGSLVGNQPKGFLFSTGHGNLTSVCIDMSRINKCFKGIIYVTLLWIIVKYRNQSVNLGSFPNVASFLQPSP